MAKSGSSLCMRAYFILHQEALVSNLLECLLYHDYAASALGDSLLDLVDYCARRAAHLVALTHQKGRPRPEDALPDPFADDERQAADSKTAAELLSKEESDPVGAARHQVGVWAAQAVYRCGVASVTMLRYLAEYCTKLPLSVMTRLLDTHDVAMLMVPLLENPPWVRKITRVIQPPAAASGDGQAVQQPQPPRPATVWQKYTEHRWTDVEPRDLLKLTATEGQPWLALHALLLEPDCRRRYVLTSHRKAQIGRVRKYLYEVLVDQLPVMVDLQRYIDETSIGAVAEPVDENGGAGRLLLEAVPQVRDSIVADALVAPVEAAASSRPTTKGGFASASQLMLSGTDAANAAASDEAPASSRKWEWPDLAAYVCKHALRVRARRIGAAPPPSSADVWPDSEDDGDLRRLGGLYHLEGFDEVAGLGDPTCARCGKPAEKRCSRCHNEWYCSRDCQVAAWKGHKSVCDLVAAHGAGPGNADPSRSN